MFVNVTIRLGLVFGSACAFCVQKLCWWPYSEIEVHVVEQRVYGEMSVVHGINTQECHAYLPKHCLIVSYCINHLQGGCRHWNWKNTNCWNTSHQMFCVHSDRHVCDHKWTVHEWRLALCCAGICWAWRDFCVSSTSHFITGLKRIQDCCLVDAISLKWGLTVAALWGMLYQSRTSSLWRGYHVKSDNCDWWNMVEGLQTGTHQSPKWYCTLSPQRHEVWQSLPPMHLMIILTYDAGSVPVYHPVQQHYTVNMQY